MACPTDRIPAAPPESRPALDRDHLTRQTFGDPDLQAELLGLFVRQARTIVASLAVPGDSGKADRLHTLIGSARAVGFFDLASEAEILERALRGPAPVGEALPAGLARAVERAIEAAATFLGASPA